MTTFNTSDYAQCVAQLRSVVNERPMARVQVLVVLLCFALNMIDGMDVVLMSYAAPVLADDWGISPSALGAVFSAALFGMTVGCLGIAPLADKIGRRRMIILALGTIGIGMLASGLSQTLTQMVLARVFTGLGVGAILASMAAMTAEFASDAKRNLCVTFVQAGYPIGAILTGFASAWLLPHYGWRYLFLGAAVITLLMLPFIYIWLPESIEFLVKKQPKNALRNVNATLQNMQLNPLPALPPKPLDVAPASVKALFKDEFRRPTLLLWAALFCGFFTLFFVISWIPKIAVDAGLPLDKSIYAGAAYNFGSFIGSIALGWISARFGLQKLIFSFFVVAAVLLVFFGSVPLSASVVLIVTFFIGITLNGGFNGYWPTAARLYPSDIRVTGVGWAVGAARAGAVFGPLVGGYLLGSGAGLGVTFTVFAAPLILAGGLTLLIRNSDFVG